MNLLCHFILFLYCCVYCNESNFMEILRGKTEILEQESGPS